MWKHLTSGGLDGSERLSMVRWLFVEDRVLVGVGSGRGVVGEDTGLVNIDLGFGARCSGVVGGLKAMLEVEIKTKETVRLDML